MASHGVPRVSGAAADKSEATKEKERRQIEEYKTLEGKVRSKVDAHDFSQATLDLTSKLLTLNPEYYTVWNYRRLILQHVFTQALQSDDTDDDVVNASETESGATQRSAMTIQQRHVALAIQDDLKFLIPLLKKFPKCYWIWNHRAWLLTKATEHLPQANAIDIWQGELGLVTKMLALDSRNFHGWNYRRKVVSELEILVGKSMVRSEYDYTTKMINSNLSNFSAWHNRSQLIPRLLDETHAGPDDRKKLLTDEFELITTALYTDPYDQSLWFYHQYLMSTLDLSAPTNLSDYPRNTSILSSVDNSNRIYYLEQEIESIREMLDGAEDCKYIYQALLENAERYLEIDAGNKFVTTREVSAWLQELTKIDPLRQGRWKDLEARMRL